jgi:hypothetical protein
MEWWTLVRQLWMTVRPSLAFRLDCGGAGALILDVCLSILHGCLPVHLSAQPGPAAWLLTWPGLASQVHCSASQSISILDACLSICPAWSSRLAPDMARLGQPGPSQCSLSISICLAGQSTPNPLHGSGCARPSSQPGPLQARVSIPWVCLSPGSVCLPDSAQGH